jgi:hypothetical protein
MNFTAGTEVPFELTKYGQLGGENFNVLCTLQIEKWKSKEFIMQT